MRPVIPCRVSQPFADPGSYATRWDNHGPAGHHSGLDFGSAWPIPIHKRKVRAVLAGRVVISEHNDTMGNWVGIYNGRYDLTVTYWHLWNRVVDLGEWVRPWHFIGRVGNTGNSTAPHLHVQVNPGRGFDYHGHVDPAVAFGKVDRRNARRAWKRTHARG